MWKYCDSYLFYCLYTSPTALPLLLPFVWDFQQPQLHQAPWAACKTDSRAWGKQLTRPVSLEHLGQMVFSAGFRDNWFAHELLLSHCFPISEELRSPAWGRVEPFELCFTVSWPTIRASKYWSSNSIRILSFQHNCLRLQPASCVLFCLIYLLHFWPRN